jgi:hypothetical protein
VNKICNVWWCERKHYARGYCHAHWLALRRYGSPYGKHRVEMERAEKVIDDKNKLIDNLVQKNTELRCGLNIAMSLMESFNLPEVREWQNEKT